MLSHEYWCGKEGRRGLAVGGGEVAVLARCKCFFSSQIDDFSASVRILERKRR